MEFFYDNSEGETGQELSEITVESLQVECSLFFLDHMEVKIESIPCIHSGMPTNSVKRLPQVFPLSLSTSKYFHGH